MVSIGGGGGGGGLYVGELPRACGSNSQQSAAEHKMRKQIKCHCVSRKAIRNKDTLSSEKKEEET